MMHKKWNIYLVYNDVYAWIIKLNTNSIIKKKKINI